MRVRAERHMWRGLAAVVRCKVEGRDLGKVLARLKASCNLNSPFRRQMVTPGRCRVTHEMREREGTG